ncbi:MAG: helix-hairpin-helix domain-containing protein [Candidatus Omnitrophota bacterium]
MFDLTQQERKVILFLICVFLFGVGVRFLLKAKHEIKVLAPLYLDIGKVDINTADKELLMSVPGIGEKLASRIIEYRGRNPAFKKMEELKNIKGMAGFRYEKVKDFLIVDGR